MANLAISFYLLLAVIVAAATGSSILCIKCDSNKDRVPGDCEKRYPSPSTCYSSDVQQFCLKAIEYEADDTQRRFVRDCTSVTESKCTNATPEELAAGAAAKICHWVCKTDGCNGSIRQSPSSVLSILLFCLIVGHLRPLSIVRLS